MEIKVPKIIDTKFFIGCKIKYVFLSFLWLKFVILYMIFNYLFQTSDGE